MSQSGGGLIALVSSQNITIHAFAPPPRLLTIARLCTHTAQHLWVPGLSRHLKAGSTWFITSLKIRRDLPRSLDTVEKKKTPKNGEFRGPGGTSDIVKPVKVMSDDPVSPVYTPWPTITHYWFNKTKQHTLILAFINVPGIKSPKIGEKVI